jgi:GntR family transcriptional regulator
MLLFARPNPASGVPIYVQIKQQLRHAIETQSLVAGAPLPTIRALAEQLVVNVNTIARVYRELEAEGFLELRQGSGAFVSNSAAANAKASVRITSAKKEVRRLIENLAADGLTADEIRRVVNITLDEVLTNLPTFHDAARTPQDTGAVE